MENQEYIIINKTAIQKRIEELEKEVAFYNEVGASHLSPNKVKVETELSLLKQILSQSTPLVPEIDKAYDAGIKDKELSQMFDNPKGRYVYNLKLDI
jgi:hypothetical protein